MKKERGEDVAGYKDMLSKIQTLSAQKNAQLSAENADLNAMIKSLRTERDAFEAGNQAIVQLLMERGVHQHQLLIDSKDGGDTLRLSVERLVDDMERQASTISKLVKEKKTLADKNEELGAKVEDLRTELSGLKTASMGSDKKVHDVYHSLSMVVATYRDGYGTGHHKCMGLL